MGQKTNPTGFRLAVRRNWQSRWYANKKDFAGLLYEDQVIREKLMEKLRQASVPRIFIERASNRVRVKIYTARPGIVIGRKGQEIEKIKEELAKLTADWRMPVPSKRLMRALHLLDQLVTLHRIWWPDCQRLAASAAQAGVAKSAYAAVQPDRQRRDGFDAIVRVQGVAR